MPQSICTVDDCAASVKARGWCQRHYNRWYHSGDLGVASPTGQCAHCGGLVQRRASGPLPKYCDRSCRDKAAYLRNRESISARAKEETAAKRAAILKTCPRCQSAFTAERHGRQRFCSKKCGQLFSNTAWRASRGECESEECSNRAIARGFCRQHHPTADTWSRGKPETRRANLRRKTQQRRARTKGDTEAELIDRDEIGERDRWKCGLCGRRVNRVIEYPDPRSPSLDHILPLSKDGRHVKANVQISHLACNVAKSNRAVGEQLLLIG